MLFASAVIVALSRWSKFAKPVGVMNPSATYLMSLIAGLSLVMKNVSCPEVHRVEKVEVVMLWMVTVIPIWASPDWIIVAAAAWSLNPAWIWSVAENPFGYPASVRRALALVS